MWYDPKVAAWVERVLRVVEAVNRGWFDNARWAHADACEAHAACCLHAGKVLDAATIRH